MDMDYDAIIVGAGLVGASAALALNAAGLRIAVVDSQWPRIATAAATDDWDGRVYAISPGSGKFLDECGVWGALEAARLCAVEDMQVYGDDLVSALNFGAYESGLRELAVIVESRELQRVLWQALE